MGNVTERDMSTLGAMARPACFEYDGRQGMTRAYTTDATGDGDTCHAQDANTGSAAYDRQYSYSGLYLCPVLHARHGWEWWSMLMGPCERSGTW